MNNRERMYNHLCSLVELCVYILLFSTSDKSFYHTNTLVAFVRLSLSLVFYICQHTLLFISSFFLLDA